MDKQEYIDNMSELMRQMGVLCNMNVEVVPCEDCPFDKYCTAIIDDGLDGPEDWIDR